MLSMAQIFEKFHSLLLGHLPLELFSAVQAEKVRLITAYKEYQLPLLLGISQNETLLACLYEGENLATSCQLNQYFKALDCLHSIEIPPLLSYREILSACSWFRKRTSSLQSTEDPSLSSSN
jgi:hypothetical protein